MPYIQYFSCLFFSANYTTFFTSVFGCLDFRDEVYLFFFVSFSFLFANCASSFSRFRSWLLGLCRRPVRRIFFIYFVSFSFLFRFFLLITLLLFIDFVLGCLEFFYFISFYLFTFFSIRDFVKENMGLKSLERLQKFRIS